MRHIDRFEGSSLPSPRGIAHVQQMWNGVPVGMYLCRRSIATPTDSSRFLLDNIHIGSGDAGTTNEHLTWTSRAYEESEKAGDEHVAVVGSRLSVLLFLDNAASTSPIGRGHDRIRRPYHREPAGID